MSDHPQLRLLLPSFSGGRESCWALQSGQVAGGVSVCGGGPGPGTPGQAWVWWAGAAAERRRAGVLSAES